ncbi:Panacea domain-containing protein [Steroidobacter flavus]|uniref:Panacea domain-containing protein n=1 Tax=Steroidobacter flavus TaxID=1842136 RepID=A0ABV8SVV1_9GAMM
MSRSSLAVADYLIKRQRERGRSLTPMQLIKLVYICHGWNLGVHKEPLITEPIEAWAYGPVIRRLYDAVKGYGSNPVGEINAAIEPLELSDAEKTLIDRVSDFYGQFSGIRLSQMTHMPNTPWEITRRQHGLNRIISNDLIEEFYARQAERGDAAATS